VGYDKHDPMGRNGGNSRNGTRTKTVFTEIGPVDIEVPRDRDGSFEPAIVRKRQRRLDGVDEIVLSLTARGLTTGEIAAMGGVHAVTATPHGRSSAGGTTRPRSRPSRWNASSR
jgi:transposase-like protein